MPLQEIRLPDVVQKLAKLKLGQAYLDEDGYTRLVKVSDGDMIVPFVEGSVNRIERGGTGGPWVKAPSHGLSSYGYDIRLGRNFKVMTAYRSAAHHVIDPTEPENMEGFFKDVNDVWALEMAPHSFALGVAMELINMPPNVTGICMPKSSLARCGLVAAITPIEAGWSGYLTLELKNETDHPLRIHAGMGIMQLIFLEGEPCDVTYAARKGKYQNQHAFPVVAR
jgi:dCTP deaminase